MGIAHALASHVATIHHPSSEAAAAPPHDIWNDLQFERRDAVEVDRVVFDLLSRAWWTKRILLPHDLSVRLPAIRRPPQYQLLCARVLLFLKHEMDVPHVLRLVK
jgi:hypothetical protein